MSVHEVLRIMKLPFISNFKFKSVVFRQRFSKHICGKTFASSTKHLYIIFVENIDIFLRYLYLCHCLSRINNYSCACVLGYEWRTSLIVDNTWRGYSDISRRLTTEIENIEKHHFISKLRITQKSWILSYQVSLQVKLWQQNFHGCVQNHKSFTIKTYPLYGIDCKLLYKNYKVSFKAAFVGLLAWKLQALKYWYQYTWNTQYLRSTFLNEIKQ